MFAATENGAKAIRVSNEVVGRRHKAVVLVFGQFQRRRHVLNDDRLCGHRDPIVSVVRVFHVVEQLNLNLRRDVSHVQRLFQTLLLRLEIDMAEMHTWEVKGEINLHPEREKGNQVRLGGTREIKLHPGRVGN